MSTHQIKVSSTVDLVSDSAQRRKRIDSGFFEDLDIIAEAIDKCTDFAAENVDITDTSSTITLGVSFESYTGLYTITTKSHRKVTSETQWGPLEDYFPPISCPNASPATTHDSVEPKSCDSIILDDLSGKLPPLQPSVSPQLAQDLSYEYVLALEDRSKVPLWRRLRDNPELGKDWTTKPLELFLPWVPKNKNMDTSCGIKKGLGTHVKKNKRSRTLLEQNLKPASSLKPKLFAATSITHTTKITIEQTTKQRTSKKPVAQMQKPISNTSTISTSVKLSASSNVSIQKKVPQSPRDRPETRIKRTVLEKAKNAARKFGEKSIGKYQKSMESKNAGRMAKKNSNVMTVERNALR
ncbi:4913_t:CDS:1 [Paraglomus brasilianum]|uniref:4913_t:CDS:1 n=1 Tax=Paraglomus brasilianum TaxID=144538 RepID=A0A9N9F8D7_9GLOM|nr:4913_t:CDS:1 [Paraglomus brasilianum]